jgi:hypothetical protein
MPSVCIKNGKYERVDGCVNRSTSCNDLHIFSTPQSPDMIKGKNHLRLQWGYDGIGGTIRNRRM